MTRSRRAIHGAISTVVQFLVFFGAQLLISPIVIKHAGSSTLGEYAVVTQAASFLSLLDLGFSGSFQRYLARSYGKGDHEKTKKIIKNARLWLGGIDIMRAIAGVCVISYLQLYHSDSNSNFELRAAFFILSAWFLVRGWLAIYSPALVSLQNIAAVNYLTMVSSLLRFAISISLLFYGLKLESLVWGMVISELFLHLGSKIIFTKKFGKFPATISDFSWPEVRQIVTFGLRSTPIGIAAMCTLHSDSLVSGLLLGTGAASILYTTKLPVLQGTMLINRIIFSATPALYELQAQMKRDKLCRLYSTLHRYNISMGLILSFGLLLFHERFVSLWVGPTQYGGSSITYLFCLYVIIITTSNVNTQFLFSKGNIGVFSAVSIFEAVSVLFFSILLGRSFGIFGVVFGAIFSHAVIGGGYLWFATFREYSSSTIYFFLNVVVRPVICIGGVAVFVALLFNFYEKTGFLAEVATYLFLSTAVIYWFVLNSSESAAVRSRVSEFWRGINRGLKN